MIDGRAIIDPGAKVGKGSKIWHWSHISTSAQIGERCSFGQNVFVGNNVKIGNNVKVQNNLSIYDNIVIEFEQYGLSSLLRNIVGASKISLSTILVFGIWHHEYLFFASIAMAFLMLCAQFFHFRAKNNWIKFQHFLFLGLSKYLSVSASLFQYSLSFHRNFATLIPLLFPRTFLSPLIEYPRYLLAKAAYIQLCW